MLSEGSKITPQDVAVAGRLLAQKYDMNLDYFIDHVADPAREQYANGDEETYYRAFPSEFLNPVQQVAWKLMANPNAVRLSLPLSVYLKSHPKGTDEAFIKYTSRHWNSVIEVIGDIEFEQLTRSHARQFVGHQIAKGNKTGTVCRMLKTIGAIIRTTITELGTRIGEVAGLGVDYVFLGHEIPHVYFRDRPWRTLKTRNSERRVPGAGVALEAQKYALALCTGEITIKTFLEKGKSEF